MPYVINSSARVMRKERQGIFSFLRLKSLYVHDPCIYCRHTETSIKHFFPPFSGFSVVIIQAYELINSSHFLAMASGHSIVSCWPVLVFLVTVVKSLLLWLVAITH